MWKSHQLNLHSIITLYGIETRAVFSLDLSQPLSGNNALFCVLSLDILCQGFPSLWFDPNDLILDPPTWEGFFPRVTGGSLSQRFFYLKGKAIKINQGNLFLLTFLLKRAFCNNCTRPRLSPTKVTTNRQQIINQAIDQTINQSKIQSINQ